MKRIAVFFLFPSLLFSQEFQNIKIGESAPLRRGLCEPSIAINRQNPKNVVAAAILDQFFYSNDSGKTWVRDTLKSSYGVWGDPVLLFDYQGNIYFSHLSDPTGENWASEEILDRIVVQKSSDGGQTWNNGSFMGMHHPKDQDKQWMAVDPQTNALYCTWTQFDDYGSKSEKDKSNILFSKSLDNGETWSKSLQINQFSGNCLDGDSTTEGAVPAVGPDGQIYVAWAFDEKIYFDKSENGKKWRRKDVVVADQPGGWEIEIPGLQRANGMPVTVCDLSNSPHRGTIYVNWVDNRNGHYDVWISKSTNEGKTWSAPLKINDDESTADQFFTWISSDPKTGNLYTVFYDRRNHLDNSTDVYLAVSKDGAETWENLKISEKPFIPYSLVFFGDYNDIDAYDGMVRPIWTRMDAGGAMSIWTAIIQFAIGN